MSTATDQRTAVNQSSSLTAGQLPKFIGLAGIVVSLGLAAAILFLIKHNSLILTCVLALPIFLIAMFALSSAVEGRRRATDRMARYIVTSFFIIAVIPLISLIWKTLSQGYHRFDGKFFSMSMRNVIGSGGGAIHAIDGTLIITGIATLISVPIGLLTAVYLVEYGQRNRLSRSITFFVDVMTGIPSIVAGLFAYTLFSILVGPGNKSGLSGAVALSVLMIPVVVRSTEEMLRLVPNELREASYALGVPKWRTILRVVIPTSIAGIITGVVLAIARVIGETAPLLVTAGITDSLNTNPTKNPMTTLPVFVYYSYSNPGTPPGPDIDRAWTGALTLILIVMGLNLIGRLIAWRFAPKTKR